jgi:hypothetical protein
MATGRCKGPRCADGVGEGGGGGREGGRGVWRDAPGGGGGVGGLALVYNVYNVVLGLRVFQLSASSANTKSLLQQFPRTTRP